MTPSPSMAAMICEGLNALYPAFTVRIVAWGDNTIRYEAVALDMARSRTSAVITNRLPELIKILKAG